MAIPIALCLFLLFRLLAHELLCLFVYLLARLIVCLLAVVVDAAVALLLSVLALPLPLPLPLPLLLLLPPPPPLLLLLSHLSFLDLMCALACCSVGSSTAKFAGPNIIHPDPPPLKIPF